MSESHQPGRSSGELPDLGAPPANRQDAARLLADLVHARLPECRDVVVYILDASGRHLLLAASSTAGAGTGDNLPRRLDRAPSADETTFAGSLWRTVPTWIDRPDEVNGTVGFASLPFRGFRQQGVLLAAYASQAQARNALADKEGLTWLASTLLALGQQVARNAKSERRLQALTADRDHQRDLVLEAWNSYPFALLVSDHHGRVVTANQQLLDLGRLNAAPATIMDVVGGADEPMARAMRDPGRPVDWLSSRFGEARTAVYCRLLVSGTRLATLACIPIGELAGRLWHSPGSAQPPLVLAAPVDDPFEAALIEPKPIYGVDLKRIYERSGVPSIRRFSAILGLNELEWARYLRNPAAPVKNVSLCLALRLTEQLPGLLQELTPQQALERVRQLTGRHITQREFSLVLGRHSAAFKQWARGDAALVTATVAYLAMILRVLEVQPDQWGLFRKLAEIEAKARGIDEIWTTGTWRHKG